MNKMNLKDIQKVIGTPKENRDVLVKSLLLDLRLKCKACKTIYDTGKSMMGLNIKGYSDASNPNILFCLFECSCGHGGGHEFAPNPFITANVSCNPYGT